MPSKATFTSRERVLIEALALWLRDGRVLDYRSDVVRQLEMTWPEYLWLHQRLSDGLFHLLRQGTL